MNTETTVKAVNESLLLKSQLDEESPSYHILVADDAPTIRQLLRALLIPLGFVFHEASNGKEALSIIQSQDLDVILLDILMPDMDGLELLRKVRQELRFTLIPIIMLTSLDDHAVIAKAYDYGASDYIIKPFIKQELISRIFAHLRQKRLTDRLDDAETVLLTLARLIAAKDSETGEHCNDHCNRLAHMAVVFGKTLGISYSDLRALRNGGILHDLGKLLIPDKILLKPGKLNPEEWGVIKKHPVIGKYLCSPLRSLNKTLQIIQYHHEKWNGTGYPEGLNGENIPYLARVFQVVDIYDALRSERIYKKAYSKEEAIVILEEESQKGFWDPQLVKTFVELLRSKPQELEITSCAEDRSEEIFSTLDSLGILHWGSKDYPESKTP